MIRTLEKRVLNEKHKPSIWLASPTAFSNALNRVQNAKSFEAVRSKLLQDIVKSVSSGDTRHLYFPMFVDGCHWVAVHVDFLKRQISIGLWFALLNWWEYLAYRSLN